MEEQSTIIELVDESGNNVKFDLVMTFDYEGKRYAALLPVDNVEGVGDDEVVMLEVEGQERRKLCLHRQSCDVGDEGSTSSSSSLTRWQTKTTRKTNNVCDKMRRLRESAEKTRQIA